MTHTTVFAEGEGDVFASSPTAQTFRASQRGCQPDHRTEPYRHQTAPTSL